MGPWLTRITLDPHSADARRDTLDVVEQYRTAMRLAPDGLGDSHRAAAGLLWRREEGLSGPQIIVQTSGEPLVDRLPGGYGSCEVRDISSLVGRIQGGGAVRFRCVASPVVATGPSGTRGKRVALRGEEEQLAWWQRKSVAAGIAVLEVSATPLRAGRSRRKPGLSVPLVRFEGVARVENAEGLTAAVAGGVGPNRVMGAGLLSVIPM